MNRISYALGMSCKEVLKNKYETFTVSNTEPRPFVCNIRQKHVHEEETFQESLGKIRSYGHRSRLEGECQGL